MQSPANNWTKFKSPPLITGLDNIINFELHGLIFLRCLFALQAENLSQLSSHNHNFNSVFLFSTTTFRNGHVLSKVSWQGSNSSTLYRFAGKQKKKKKHSHGEDIVKSRYLPYLNSFAFFFRIFRSSVMFSALTIHDQR